MILVNHQMGSALSCFIKRILTTSVAIEQHLLCVPSAKIINSLPFNIRQFYSILWRNLLRVKHNLFHTNFLRNYHFFITFLQIFCDRTFFKCWCEFHLVRKGSFLLLLSFAVVKDVANINLFSSRIFFVRCRSRDFLEDTVHHGPSKFYLFFLRIYHLFRKS